MPAGHLIETDRPVSGQPCWETEEFLKKMTDIVPNIIYVFNQQTRSNEYTNRSIGEALGYDAEEVMGMGADLLPRLIHPSDLESVSAHFNDIAMLADDRVLQTEYRVRHKDGHYVWLLSNDTVFDRDESGAVRRHIGVASDITTLKATEERLIAEQLRAATTKDELMNFTYSMSHDMKSPSNTLDMLLGELMECHDTELSEQAAELCALARQTVGELRALCDDTLQFTHIINKTFDPVPVRLDALVERVLERMAPRIAARRARIEAGPLPEVIADSEQLEALFENLIDNAIKFHDGNGTPCVWITAQDLRDGVNAAVSVRDNGIGIDPGKHQHVFGVFKRLHRRADYAGTGLGLAICRRVAANHGSKIRLCSALGEGAEFTFELRLP